MAFLPATQPISATETRRVLFHIIIPVSVIIGITLFAACTGCLACCSWQRSVRRARIRSFTNKIEETTQGRNTVVETEDVCQSSDLESNNNQHTHTTVARDAFFGRELASYKRERMLKARASGSSAQHTPLPIPVQYLKEKQPEARMTQPALTIGILAPPNSVVNVDSVSEISTANKGDETRLLRSSGVMQSMDITKAVLLT